jgi:hypothetical protein
MNARAQISALDSSPEWRDQSSISLDAPWPDPSGTAFRLDMEALQWHRFPYRWAGISFSRVLPAAMPLSRFRERSFIYGTAGPQYHRGSPI